MQRQKINAVEAADIDRVFVGKLAHLVKRVHPTSSAKRMHRHVRIELVLGQQSLPGVYLQITLIAANHDRSAPPA